MKPRQRFAAFTACIFIATVVSACATRYGFSRDEYDEYSITVRIQSPADEAITAGTDRGLVTTFVWVDVLAPSQIRADKVKLVLQEADARQLKRIAPGKIWREVGSIQVVHVIVDKVSHEIFLWPPDPGA